MDTRKKIVSLSEVSGRVFDRFVVGYFDPVVAAHVTRLEALGGPVTVSLLDPPDAILPARARAELVAALGSVETVIIGDARAQARQVIDLTGADLETRQALIERIRHRSAPPAP